MKKARLSVKSIVLHDVDHRNWDRLGKHINTKTRYRVWDNLGCAFIDQYVDPITDAIRSKS